jgi:ribosomal protein S18 acetylase RimI-like enzyme
VEWEIADATPDELDGVRALLHAYADALGDPLDFQDFERELASLPGEYAAPRGALLVARSSGVPAACVALRPLSESTCELKRLYVDPQARGGGLGRRLTLAAIDRARMLGYTAMRLDTVAGMEAAQALYRALGFEEIEPYTHNPLPGARFLELRLEAV